MKMKVIFPVMNITEAVTHDLCNSVAVLYNLR